MIDPSQERPPGVEPAAAQEGLSRSEWALVALAVVVAGGGVAFWLLRPTAPPPPAALATPAPPSPAPPPAPAGPAPAPAPTAASEATRALLEAVSPHPDYRAWLGAGDVLNRWAVVADNLAEGVSPRKALGPLAPARPFTVAQRGALTVIAPEAYRRYDRVGDAVASVDPAAFAAAYRALHPVLEAAWRTLGQPHGSLDAVAARALSRLADAPVAEGEVVVEAAGPVLYLFADPALEAQGPVEKQLLRMGPRNTRIVKAQAGALLKALGLKPSAPAAR